MNKTTIRQLEVIAYEEAHDCKTATQAQRKRAKAFDLINNLEGNDSYMKPTYIKTYIAMVNEYKHK